MTTPITTYTLIWYQRLDGLWNAECACDATCAGFAHKDRKEAEKFHFDLVAKDRAEGKDRKPCGPKFQTKTLITITVV